MVSYTVVCVPLPVRQTFYWYAALMKKPMWKKDEILKINKTWSTFLHGFAFNVIWLNPAVSKSFQFRLFLHKKAIHGGTLTLFNFISWCEKIANPWFSAFTLIASPWLQGYCVNQNHESTSRILCYGPNIFWEKLRKVTQNLNLDSHINSLVRESRRPIECRELFWK